MSTSNSRDGQPKGWHVLVVQLINRCANDEEESAHIGHCGCGDDQCFVNGGVARSIGCIEFHPISPCFTGRCRLNNPPSLLARTARQPVQYTYS
jgi:hypothetical protein